MGFRSCPCDKNFLPLFPSSYKTHHINASCYDQISVCSKRPWFVISTVYSFYRRFFPRPHVEWFQSTEVKQFCPRLRLIGRSVEIIISHVVDIVDTFFSYSNEIKAKSIFVWYSNLILKVLNNFFKKMLKIWLKISEWKMHQQMNIIWLMSYIINK